MATITPDEARRELARRELARREQSKLSPSYSEEVGRGLLRGAAKAGDFATGPVRALSQALVGRSPPPLESLIDPPTTGLGNIAEKTSELGLSGGGISALSKQIAKRVGGPVGNAIASYFAPARDTALSAAAGAAGQSVREAPDDYVPPYVDTPFGKAPVKEPAAFATELLTPAATTKAAQVAVDNKFVERGLRLAKKVPTVRMINEVRQMLTKSGQEEAADDWFRAFMEDDLERALISQKGSGDVFGVQPTAGADMRSGKLLGVEEAYFRTGKVSEAGGQLRQRRSELGAAHKRGLSGLGRDEDMYFEHVIRSRMAEELPDWSRTTITNWVEKHPDLVGRLSDDSLLAGQLRNVIEGKRSSMNIVLSHSRIMYKRARKVFGMNPVRAVGRLFDKRYEPGEVAEELMANVKGPKDYEAVTTMVVEDLSSKISAWTRNNVEAKTPDMVEKAHVIYEALSRPGLTAALNKIFRDKSARDMLAGVRDHMSRYSTEIDLSQQVPEVPSQIARIGGKVLGARVGRNISAAGGSGGDIQTPGIFSKFFGDMVAGATGGHFHARVRDLLTDRSIRTAVLERRLDPTLYAKHGKAAIDMKLVHPAPLAAPIANQPEQERYGSR